MVILDNIGKKFKREWILKDFSSTFNTNQSVAVTGPNGSGKSTFLKLISGFLTPTKGSISYSLNNVPINNQNIYKHVAYAAPYIDVFEEYTLKELFEFYTKFKSLNNLSFKEFTAIIELTNTKDKALKNFSSGMRQRVKLGLSILSKTDILLLDEPTSNLDKHAIKWYQELITNHLKDRIVFVASNAVDEESFFCKESINILNYK